MGHQKLSMVIPVYFNAGSLPVLFERIQALEEPLSARSVELELIFVEDGSKDGSLALLLDFKKKRPATKVVKLTRNFGPVHCTKTGFRFVTGDAFMSVAADLQDPIDLIPEMVDRWRAGAKFVICERITRSDPVLSRLFSKIFYVLLRILVIQDYPKGGYDMPLMDKVFLSPLLDSSKNTYDSLLAYWLGYKPEVVQYHRPARPHGKSRWTLMKKINSFFDVMLGFSVAPIRLISAFGAVVAVASFSYGTAVVISSLLGAIPVKGYSVIVTLITFLLGLIILMLGIIGEYLWRIFDEINHRPETVIEEVY